MANLLNTESLRAAVTNFRAIRALGSNWKMWVENKALQVHVTTPDGWTSRVSFCSNENLGAQATAFLNAEYERWIGRQLVEAPNDTVNNADIVANGSRSITVSKPISESIASRAVSK